MLWEPGNQIANFWWQREGVGWTFAHSSLMPAEGFGAIQALAQERWLWLDSLLFANCFLFARGCATALFFSFFLQNSSFLSFFIASFSFSALFCFLLHFVLCIFPHSVSRYAISFLLSYFFLLSLLQCFQCCYVFFICKTHFPNSGVGWAGACRPPSRCIRCCTS